MAAIITDETSQRVCCDVPKCKKTRQSRGQQNGRFLFRVEWGEGTVTITTICAECGSNHSVTIPIPRTAIAPQ